jgi:hypothetical protein
MIFKTAKILDGYFKNMPIKYLYHLIALLRFIYNRNELLRNIKYFNLIIPP